MNNPCELYQLIPRDKLDAFFETSEVEGDYTFLGFEEVYKAVTLFVPKDKVILDLGCAYGFQAYYFRDYKKYIGVDHFCETFFETENSEYYHMSIQLFLFNVFPTLGYKPEEVFAICSYVSDECARNKVREIFPNCLIYYPESEE